MFEIGPALREARERQQLSYSAGRGGHQDPRPVHPGAGGGGRSASCPAPRTPRASCGRTPTTSGLDGHLFIDEFNSRLPRPPRRCRARDLPQVAPRPREQRQRRETNIVLIVLAAIVADRVAGLPGLQLLRSGERQPAAAAVHADHQHRHAAPRHHVAHRHDREDAHPHPHNPGQVPDRDHRRQRQLVALRPPRVRRRPGRRVGAWHRSLAVPAAAGRGGCDPGQRAGRASRSARPAA